MNYPDIITETGICFPKVFSKDELFKVGCALGGVEKSLQWAIGDWLNQIPPEDKKDACKEVGISYETAQKYAVTCEKIPQRARARSLNFTIYAVACTAKLEDKERTLLLTQAEKEQWTAAYLRNQIKQVQNNGEPVEPAKLEVDGLSQQVDSVVADVSDALPKNTTNKIKKLITKHLLKLMTSMQDDFENQVSIEVDKRLATARFNLKKAEKEAKIERERFIFMQSTVNTVMTKAEYKVIVSCLHPDKNNGSAKHARAFEIFNRLKEAIPSDLPAKTKKAQGWD